VLRAVAELPAGWEVSTVDRTAVARSVPFERLERGRATLLRVTALPPDLVPGPGELRLVDPERGGAVVVRWPVRWDVPPEERPALVPIVALRTAGRLPEARAALAAALPAMDAETRLWAAVEEARLHQQEGDGPGALAAWERAAEVAAAAGVPTEVSRRYRAAAQHALRMHRFTQAEALLERAAAASASADDPVAAGRSDYLRAIAARELGDLRTAVRLFRRARALAWTLGVDADWSMATELLAALLQDLGRHGEALELLDALQTYMSSRPPDGVTTARLRRARAWVLAKAMVEGAVPADWQRARALFESALTATRSYPDPTEEAETLLGLAWLEWQAGAPERARAVLAAADRLHAAQRSWTRLFAALLRAELHLAAGDPDGAAAAFAAVEARASEELGGAASESAWRARYGLGRARLLVGDEDGALAAFRAALALRDQLGRRTALRDERAPYFADRRAVVDDTARLLLARGDAAGALAVATAEQTRVLRAVESRLRVSWLSREQRAAWEARVARYHALRDEHDAARQALDLSAGPERDALAARAATLRADVDAAFEDAWAVLDAATGAAAGTPDDPGAALLRAALGEREALLAFVRLGAGWQAFVVTRAGVETAPVGDPARPLAGWDERLAAVEHVFVVAGGLAAAESYGGLALADGRLLLEHVGLSWLPDAATLLRLPRAAAGPTGAPLVVADPRRDLPHAAREGRELAARLAGARLLAGDDASRGRVLGAADEAPLLHFAGHGELHAGDPWDAHLQLAGEETLTVADVLAARPRPGLVVLSGCRTGQQAALSRSESLSLPAAFLLAGARAVVAADRDLKDEDARRFVARFYQEGGLRQPGRALRATALALRREGDGPWDAFRLMGRP
jgi:hypothetical protein